MKLLFKEKEIFLKNNDDVALSTYNFATVDLGRRSRNIGDTLIILRIGLEDIPSLY